MPQYRYTVQQHNITTKSSARLSHVNIYDLNEPSVDIFPGYPYTKIIFIGEGKAVLSFDDHELEISGGHILLLNPGNSRFSLSIEGRPLKITALGIENITFRDLPVYGRILSMESESLAEDFTGIIERIIRELQLQKEDYSSICTMGLHMILICLERDYGITWDNVTREKKGRDCTIVKEYLDNHYKQNLTLDMLSEESGMNKYYLVHSFTKLYGCSPISYLNEKRIEASKNLLENTDMSIAEIALELGFSSQSYFSQSFKKNTYMTPNEYRRSTRMV